MATHENLKSSNQVKIGSERSFGFVFAGFFLVLSVLPALHGRELRLWPLPLALAFLLVAQFRPDWLKPLNRLWFRFGLLLNELVSPLVMGALFFLLITPIALVGRLASKAFLDLAADPEASTYWIDRSPPGPPAGSMTNQF